MPFEIVEKRLNGIVVVKTIAFDDPRGFFMEAFRADQFAALGLPSVFPQDNHSRSAKDVVRGLHFQFDPKIGKLMRVTQGRAWLVAVDIRKRSPTLGQHYGLEVSAANRLQVWAPPGFARGFCTLDEGTELQYKCTAIYNPHGEGGIRWNDPALAIPWPAGKPLLSPKDEAAPTLAEWLTTPAADLLAD